MHPKAVTLFILCALMAGFLFWMTALIVWPLPGKERGCAGWPCAVLVAAAGCTILAAGAGRLWYAGSASSPLVFGAVSLITPAGRHHHRKERSEEEADG